MKIEGNRPNQQAAASEAQSAQQAERLQSAVRPDRGGRAGASSGGDRVDVSRDAQLLDSAVRAVNTSPPIRQDVVERARQKLLSGELGKDTNKLADRIIDSLLSR